jgi:hypothetical protein
MFLGGFGWSNFWGKKHGGIEVTQPFGGFQWYLKSWMVFFLMENPMK